MKYCHHVYIQQLNRLVELGILTRSRIGEFTITPYGLAFVRKWGNNQ